MNVCLLGPAEQLPALEHGSQLPDADADAGAPESDFEAARLLLRYLKDRVRDLDKELSETSRAEVGGCLPQWIKQKCTCTSPSRPLELCAQPAQLFHSINRSRNLGSALSRHGCLLLQQGGCQMMQT